MKQCKKSIPGGYQFLALLVLLSIIGTGGLVTSSPVDTEGIHRLDARETSLLTENHQTTVYLPMVLQKDPWISPFGVQPKKLLTSGNLLNRLQDLGVGWVRLQDLRIRWRVLQPEENAPIQWHLLEPFENELRALRERRITPVVVIYDSPRWATIHPTSCGAVRADKFSQFAAFVSAVVERYKAPEFNVHHWELGNEPDVDPRLVRQDNGFGCWGDIDDPFYGGRHYGEMLKVVGPAIRAANPAARIWIGGLLLASPHTTEAERGRPELFLQGILEAGAAPHFDIVPYHLYLAYRDQDAKLDDDKNKLSPWYERGGNVIGKATYLRDLMTKYDVEKPVVLNETAFSCPNDPYLIERFPWCAQPSDKFYQMQADMLVRMFVRGLSANIYGFFWYTLESPGWRYGSLLDRDETPKPVYIAYQHLIQQLSEAVYEGTIDYGEGIEAYLFRRGLKTVQVVWAKEDTTIPITIPQANFVNAFDRDGNLISPIFDGERISLSIGFEAIYIVQASN